MTEITTTINQTYWEKLKLNIKTSYKFASVRVTGAISIALLAYGSLPSDCAGQAADCMSRATVNSIFHMPTWLVTVLGFLAIYYARVHPEKNITPNEAAAKSMDAPQPVDGDGHATP